MPTLKEGEILKCLRDGRLFQVKRVANDFVILNSVDGSSQIMAGKRGFDFIFEKIPPSMPFPKFAMGQALQG